MPSQEATALLAAGRVVTRPELGRQRLLARRWWELFDLPDAPTPPADLPAAVRFLPEFDAPCSRMPTGPES